MEETRRLTGLFLTTQTGCAEGHAHGVSKVLFQVVQALGHKPLVIYTYYLFYATHVWERKEVQPLRRERLRRVPLRPREGVSGSPGTTRATGPYWTAGTSRTHWNPRSERDERGQWPSRSSRR